MQNIFCYNSLIVGPIPIKVCWLSLSSLHHSRHSGVCTTTFPRSQRCRWDVATTWCVERGGRCGRCLPQSPFLLCYCRAAPKWWVGTQNGSKSSVRWVAVLTIHRTPYPRWRRWRSLVVEDYMLGVTASFIYVVLFILHGRGEQRQRRCLEDESAERQYGKCWVAHNIDHV